MKNLFTGLLLLAPILLLIVLINLVVDPARLFKNKDYEKKMSETLMAGSAITDLAGTNFDDRNMHKFLIQSQKNKLDIAVFGSSRAMLISSAIFPGKTLLNNSLAGATLEDFVSLYEIYRETGMVPSTIILGVDPWDFNKNNGREAWRLFGQYYTKFNNLNSANRFAIKIRPQDLVPYQIQQLVSLSYFQSSIQFLRAQNFHLLLKPHWFTISNQKFNENETILPDGSYTWRRSQRDADPADVIKEIQKDKDQNQALDMQGYLEMDRGLKQQFINLIQAMKKDGVKVILFLPPYHPFEYNRYVHSDQFKIIQEVENYLKATSSLYGLTLVGSYDPGPLSIPANAFADGYHLRDGTQLKRIFLNVLN